MLHSTDIIKAMKDNSDCIAGLNEKIKMLDDDFRNTTFDDFKKRHAEFDKKQIISSSYYQEVYRRGLLGRILKDNARRAFFAESLPVILEILKKYEGKPIGEKTEQKIAAEAEEKIGHRIYLDGQNEAYGTGKITISWGDYRFKWEDFQISLKNGNNKMFNGNKLVVYPIEEYYLCNCAEYVEDPEAHADNILAAYENLKQMEREFDKACGEFNKLLPSDINYIYSRNFRSYLF